MFVLADPGGFSICFDVAAVCKGVLQDFEEGSKDARVAPKGFAVEVTEPIRMEDFSCCYLSYMWHRQFTKERRDSMPTVRNVISDK
eukprot:2452981-Amphidinium_carterae.1